MRPIRSLLFAPANRPDLIRKFPRYAADAFAIDLEDATPEAEKHTARSGLSEVVRFLREQNVRAQVFVRTNKPGSPHVEADLKAALETEIDGLMMPKLETLGDLHLFADAMGEARRRRGCNLQLAGILETARGVTNVEALAAATESGLTCLAFGAEDFMTDLGGRRTPEGLEVLYARSRVILTARAAGLQALDQVFVNIRDDEAFRRDAEVGRQLGYTGKMCIVPRQVEIANTVFSPSAEEIDRSRRLIEAYETAQSAGRGVIEFEGAMVDEPLLKRARTILDAVAEDAG